MECKIVDYTFIYDTESKQLSIYHKNSITPEFVYKPDKELVSQKDLEVESSFWYMKNA